MKKNYANAGYPKIGLLAFVSREIELNIHLLNGNNNKKMNVTPEYAKYKSSIVSAAKSELIALS